MKLFKSANLTTVLLIGSLAAGSGLLSGCDKNKNDKASLPEKVPEKIVQKAAEQSTSTSGGTETLQLTDNRNLHVVSGQIVAMQSTEIGFQAAGFIHEIQHDSGDVVKKDEVLALLDDTDAKLALQVAEVRLEQSESAFEAARRELEREKQLKQAAASSVATFDQIRTAFDQAKSSKELAGLEVKRARITLERTKLKAPYDGIVSGRKKSTGEYVASGATVYEFVSNSNPEIRLQLPEQLLTKVQKDQKISIAIPSINVKTTATISRIVPVISDRSRSFVIHAQLVEPNVNIVPGLFVEAKIDSSGSH